MMNTFLLKMFANLKAFSKCKWNQKKCTILLFTVHIKHILKELSENLYCTYWEYIVVMPSKYCLIVVGV